MNILLIENTFFLNIITFHTYLIQFSNMYQVLLLSLLTSLQVVISIPLIILHIFKLQAFRIADKCEINKFINNLKIKGSTIISNEKPEGFIYGKWYLGYILLSDGQNGKINKLFISL